MTRISLSFLGALLAAGTLGCGGGGASTPNTPNPPGGAVAITIVGENGSQSFAPNPATVRVGQSVSWRNADRVVHHIVEDADDGSSGRGDVYGDPGAAAGAFDAGVTDPGATSKTLTAGAVGTTRYHCSIHPSMVGTLTIVP